jgi:preprotein translocase subunit YajC
MRHLSRWTFFLLLVTFALPLRADDKKPAGDQKSGGDKNPPAAKPDQAQPANREIKADEPPPGANPPDDKGAPAGGKQPAERPDPFGSMLPLLAILFCLYIFVVLRPQSRRQEAERRALLNSMKKGDRVLTHSGIYGTVISVAENENEVTVKVDDNVRLRMTKESIARNLRAEEEARAAKEKPKEGAA